MQDKKYILIVDLLSSAKYLVDRFLAEGYHLVVLATLNLRSGGDYCNYDSLECEVINSSHSIAEDIKALEKYKDNIVAGIYGSEMSVEYADKILTKLFPNNSNTTESSAKRFDKYAMIDALRDTNHAIKQIKAPDNDHQKCIELTTEFFKKHGKIVIKPASSSAASFGVFAPENEQEISEYFATEDHFMADGVYYVVQEKINIVEEYYVDCASYGGEHVIVNTGKYKKNEKHGCFEYVYADKIDVHEIDPKLKEFTHEVLNKLGMQNGLSHIEIALNEKNEYKLIELNPRISGGHGFINIMSKDANEPDQVDAFLALVNQQTINYDIRDSFYQRLIFLRSEKQKAIKDELQCLTEFHPLTPASVKQSNNEKYSMLSDCYGFMILANKDKALIEADTDILVANS